MSEIQEKKTSDVSTKPVGDVHRIRYGGFEFSIPTLAFGLMLAGILLPPVMYSLSLKNPTPTVLLIAICVSLFSAVVFLWILDTTSVLRFRSEWVSKSIYGAAIVSVLGTSVAVYKEAFSERKYQYEGRWEIQIRKDGGLIGNNELVMMYSTVADSYYGFSNYTAPTHLAGLKVCWLKVNEFDEKTGRTNISLFAENGQEDVIETTLNRERNGKLFITSYPKKTDNGKETRIQVSLSRPKH